MLFSLNISFLVSIISFKGTIKAESPIIIFAEPSFEIKGLLINNFSSFNNRVISFSKFLTKEIKLEFLLFIFRTISFLYGIFNYDLKFLIADIMDIKFLKLN